MTEAEAKTKWCPFARDSETAGNRSFSLPDEIRFPCIGSNCMAWRATGDKPRQMGDRHGIAWVATGYCGLAGAPL